MQCYPVKEVTHFCNISVPRCHAISRAVIDFYDLTFVVSGSMTYTANGKLITLNKNDAIFLPPGTVRTRLVGDEPVKYISFNFNLNSGCSFPFPEHMVKCLSSDIKRLVSAFPQGHLTSYYHSHEKAVNILNYILFDLLDIQALKSSNEHVLNITKYIEEHITEPLNLTAISDAIGLSKEHTSYLFKREMGKTLTDYINERKMVLAKELILSQEMRLSDVAIHLGYENYGYFSRLFKRHFDISPVKLRNE